MTRTSAIVDPEISIKSVHTSVTLRKLFNRHRKFMNAAVDLVLDGLRSSPTATAGLIEGPSGPSEMAGSDRVQFRESKW